MPDEPDESYAPVGDFSVGTSDDNPDFYLKLTTKDGNTTRLRFTPDADEFRKRAP
jgi:hypothetical protein